MSFKKEESSLLPYSRAAIMEAMPAVCEKMKWKIETLDKNLGIVRSRARESALSWGEIITINVKEYKKNSRVYVRSESFITPYGGTVFSIIKNRLNIRNFFKELNKALEGS